MLAWDLAQLRKRGEAAFLEAFARRDENRGRPVEQFAAGYISREVVAVSKRIRAQRDAEGDRYPAPPGQQIAEALETFSEQEWRNLIPRFEQRDLKPLRAYLDANREKLEHGSSQGKYRVILANAVERELILLLQRPLRMIPVTDPMWALLIREQTQQLKMELGPRPSRKRTADEMGRANAIAEGLSRQGHKVTPYKVTTYFERMERVPFDQFDGSVYDYFAMIADTRAYKRFLRSQELD